MKNWNTDTSRFRTKKDKRLWELSQLVNYGLEDEKLNEKELRNNWAELKTRLDPERARMLEYLIWGNLYSLPNKKRFWGLSPKPIS